MAPSETLQAGRASLTIEGSEIRLKIRRPGAPKVIEMSWPRPRIAHNSIWLRLTVANGTLQGFVSENGRNWQPVGRPTGMWSARTLAGVAVWAGEAVSDLPVRFQHIALADGSPAVRTPFRARHTLPGRVEGEDFDRGGEGQAYHELADEAPMAGSVYRSESVEIDSNGGQRGYHVRSTQAGEWLEYSVDVRLPARYRARLHVASRCCGGKVHLEIGGVDKTGPITIPNTNSETEDWAEVSSRDFELNAGRTAMRLVVDEESLYCPGSAGSIDAIDVERALPPLPDGPKEAKPAAPAGNSAPSGALLFAPTLFAEVKRHAESKDSYANVLLGAIRTRVDAVDTKPYDQDPDDDEINLARAALARDAALLFRITGERHYADLAFRQLEAIYSQPDGPNVTLAASAVQSPADLAYRASLGLAFTVTYDWLAEDWTSEQRSFVADKMREALNGWECLGVGELGAPHLMALVPAWRGAELLLIKALREERIRAPRYVQLQQWLKTHLRDTYGSLGLSPAGPSSTSVGLGHLVPVVLALRQSGDTDLESDFTGRQWWRLFMAICALGPQGPLHLGADSATTPHRMTAAAAWLMAVTPSDALPTYAWFFDRFAGAASAPDLSAVSRTGATPWALLFYPHDTKTVDPNGAMAGAVADEKQGTYFFRNRWRDSDDIQFAVGGDYFEDRGPRLCRDPGDV